MILNRIGVYNRTDASYTVTKTYYYRINTTEKTQALTVSQAHPLLDFNNRLGMWQR
jgi:hypothetical protein